VTSTLCEKQTVYFQMAENSSFIKMEEMRPGLFRIHWTLENRGSKLDDHQREEFLLCGGHSGWKFSINYDAKYGNELDKKIITVNEISCNGDSTVSETNKVVKLITRSSREINQEQLKPAKRPKIVVEGEQEILRPALIWIYTDPDSDCTNPFPLNRTSSTKWQVDCVGKKIWIILWIDFRRKTNAEKKCCSGLGSLFKNQIPCDVNFIFVNGQSVIGAHEEILSSASAKFFIMFHRTDYDGPRPRKVIVDNNIDDQAFNQLLSFLYTETAPKLTDIISIQSLLMASSFYGIEALKEKCVKMLEKQLKTKNAIVRESASSLRPIFSQPEWLDLLKNHPELSPPIDQRVATLRPKTKK
jgi:hypothetical protein